MTTATTATTAIIVPTVNLNGASRDSLIDQNTAVILMLDDTLRLLYSVAPHPRDFQTAPAGEYYTARIQHEARCHLLFRVRTELNTIVEGLLEQGR